MTVRTLWRKEWLEALRTYRVLVMLLVFLLLGIAQPIVYHLMPTILEQTGLPEGMVLELPPLAPNDILSSVFDQYTQVGILVVVLIAMGAVNREIEAGVAGLLFALGCARPVYWAAKWLVLALLSIGAVLVGTLGAAYYTTLLFAPVHWGSVVAASLVYSLQIVFVVSLTLLLSTVFDNQLVTAAAAIGVSLALGLVGSVVPSLAPWLPFSSAAAAKILAGVEGVPWRAVLTSLAWSALFCLTGLHVLQRRDV